MQRLLRAQDGVVARRQLLALGARGHDLERLLRRRELAIVHSRARLRRRRLVLAVLDDVEAGACSVLERGYLTRVERAHCLPRAVRQLVRRTDAGVEYRDVEYVEFGLVVELDGRVGHDGWAAGGRDADRDLDDRAAGRETVRLRHQQVFDTPCRTATRVGAILRRRGWAGSPRSCGPECVLTA